MADVRIEFNSEGFRQILLSQGCHDLVQQTADEISEKANGNNTRGGSGFESGTRLGKAYGSQRAIGFVYTTDRKSRIAESEDKALSKAVRG